MKTITLVTLLILFLFACSQSSKKNQPIKSTDVSTNPDDLSGKKTYVNPADGKTYASEAEWKTYEAENKKIDTGNVKVKQVILLTNQNDIPARISIEKLAEFIKKTEVIVKEAMEESDKKGEILVQITLSDSKAPKVDVSARDAVDGEKVKFIYSEIEKLADYTTQQDSVIFQTHYTINK